MLIAVIEPDRRKISSRVRAVAGNSAAMRYASTGYPIDMEDFYHGDGQDDPCGGVR